MEPASPTGRCTSTYRFPVLPSHVPTQDEPPVLQLPPPSSTQTTSEEASIPLCQSTKRHKRRRLSGDRSGCSPPLKQRAQTSTTASESFTPAKANLPDIVDVKIVELLGDTHLPSLKEVSSNSVDEVERYGLFVWQSALLLAYFVAAHNRSLFSNKTVLELGCGTALPGLLAAKCGNPKKVYLTDRDDSVTIEGNVESTIEANKLMNVATYSGLDWGQVNLSADQLTLLSSVDIILAADCFYNPEDFEKVLATVALIFKCRQASTSFYVTYQLRSLNYSIAPQLAQWNMEARLIPKTSFLPFSLSGSVSHDSRQEQQVQAGFDSLFLYQIYPKE